LAEHEVGGHKFMMTRLVEAFLCSALCACSSKPTEPARTATPEETRRLYPALFVVVTPHAPPPGCYLASEDPIVAPGEDPQQLSLSAAKIRANFVTYLGRTTIMSGVAPHIHTQPAVYGTAYWCPGR
jgi:hypothetical protein